MDELDLFANAIAVADPVERAALLDRECAGKQALRERLDELLRAHDRSHDLLDRPAGQFNTVAVEPAPKMLAGTVIAGRYKLLEEIGDGGMGTVWMAEQRTPVKRLVAVKLIKAGMDSKAVLARFEAERQALAVMDHPNIAKVLDAGTDEKGRPYFVMELVKGLPLTEYCDARRLSVKDRLELFVQICSAIQHAHQKAVIHRDLKPSNILVTEHDGKPVPKVIDFGLAKALGATNTLTDMTLHTAYGTVVGTPLYMAPEQVGINALDVDTRTDIYALGVILYELLTGTTPLEKARFKEAAWEEVKRLIREEEPPRPSIRLSSAQTLPSLAACRQIEPTKLRQLVRGELDWIVMKALEKDRGRRYETANGLARDIHRYLSDEAVEACPPTASYRLRKFIRKYRTAIATTATIAALLLAGIAVSTWQAIRATRAEGSARASAESEKLANQEAQKSAAAEKQANTQSQKRLAQLQKGNEVITSIFDDLDIRKVKEGTDPLELVLAQRLAKAAKQLEGDAVGDPLVVAELQFDLANSLDSLGQWREAANLYIKARDTYVAQRGPDDRNAIAAARSVADCYNLSRQWELALPIWQETLKRAKEKLGPDDHITLMCMSGLATCHLAAHKPELALPIFEETTALLRAKRGPDDRDTLNAMNNVATCCAQVGQVDRAIAIYEELLKQHSLQMGTEHPDTITWMSNLGSCYAKVGKLNLALPMMEKAVELEKAKLGIDHPETRHATRILADAYKLAGKLDLARPLLEDLLKLSKEKLGNDDVETAEVTLALTSVYNAANKPLLSIQLLEPLLKTLRDKQGSDGPATLTCMASLALSYRKTNQFDLALPLNEEFIRRTSAIRGADDVEVLNCMENQAEVYIAAGKHEKALPFLEELCKLRRAKLGSENPATVRAIYSLGMLYMRIGKLNLGISLLEETLKAKQATPGHEEVGTLDLVITLGTAYQQTRQPGLAQPLLERALKICRSTLPADNPQTLKSLSGLALVYRSLRKFDDAIALNDEFIRLARAKFGDKHTDVLRCLQNQGYTYQEVGRPELAVPLFEEVLKTRRAELGSDHADTLFAIQNLAVCSRAAGKSDRAAALFEELFNFQRDKLGADHADTLNLMAYLGLTLWESRQFDKSIPVFQELLALREKKLGRDHLDTLGTMGNLGVNLRDSGRYEEAIPFLEEASRASLKYPPLRIFNSELMFALFKAGKVEAAMKRVDQEIENARAQLPPASMPLAGKLAEFSVLLLDMKRFDAAEPLLREALTIREKSAPDAWTTFNTTSMLGGALLGQKKYADAQPLLIKGYEGLKQRESTIPKAGGGDRRIPQALDRLIELSTATDKPDDVKKWQAERAKYSAATSQPAGK